MNNQRNNFSALPFEARKRVMFLLLDGATQDAVRNDPEVAKACDERGLKLHSTTFQAVVRSKEFAEYKAAREATEARTANAKWAADFLRMAGGVQDVATVTELQLLEQLRALSDGGLDDPKELLQVTAAVSKLKDSANADRIRRLRREIEEKDAEIAKLKEAHEALKARFEAEIAALRDGASAADPAEVADRLDAMLGLTRSVPGSGVLRDATSRGADQ